MMPLRVYFDLDGTLVDSKSEILDTLDKALIDNGFSMSDREHDIRLGPPVRQMILDAYPTNYFSEKDLDNIVSSFRRVYDASSFEKTQVFAGIDKVLRSQEILPCLLTNKPLDATYKILYAKGWSNLFDSVLVPKKENNETKESILRDLKGGLKELFIMVGDTDNDTGSAFRAGVPSIGVLWGEGTYEELITSGATLVCQNPNDLLACLKKLRYFK